MTRPRPSRRARWAIGLSLTGLFTLVALGAAVVAVTQLVSNAAGSAQSEDWTDSSADATILDVDVFDLDYNPMPLSFDREGGDAGHAEVDIRFTNNGGSADGVRTSVGWLDWPDDMELPKVGATVPIEYNSTDPENGPELAGDADGRPGVGSVGLVVPTTTEDDGEPAGVTAPVRWTIAGSGTLALLTLVATIIWARRAEPAEARPGVPPSGTWTQPAWNQPAWGQSPAAYPGPPRYPPAQYPPDQYPPDQYPPDQYPPAQYPPAQYPPAQYSPDQRPSAQYPPPGSPPQSPPPPSDGGYTLPG